MPLKETMNVQTPEAIDAVMPPAPDEAAMLAAAGIVPVADLDQFIQMLTGWHQHKVATLQHMLSVPEGTGMVINGTDTVTLEGDMRKGFIAGIELALMELGKLPFVVEMEEDPIAPAAPHVG